MCSIKVPTGSFTDLNRLDTIGCDISDVCNFDFVLSVTIMGFARFKILILHLLHTCLNRQLMKVKRVELCVSLNLFENVV